MTHPLEPRSTPLVEAQTAYLSATIRDVVDGLQDGHIGWLCRVLRETIIVASRFDLPAIPLSHAERLHDLMSSARELFQEQVPAADRVRFEAGIAAALQLVGMFGRSWDDLADTAPRDLVLDWIDHVVVLANLIENMVAGERITARGRDADRSIDGGHISKLH